VSVVNEISTVFLCKSKLRLAQRLAVRFLPLAVPRKAPLGCSRLQHTKGQQKQSKRQKQDSFFHQITPFTDRMYQILPAHSAKNM
jgi:hypothetical protein